MFVASQLMTKSFCVRQHVAQKAARESNIICIVQVTFKFVNKALLIHNFPNWLPSLSQFKILFSLSADKDRL